MDTRLAHDASYEKLTISLRYWLLGKGYFKALKAMEYAAKFHTGTRKDGTPEFSHQIWQAHYLRSITGLLVDPEACLIVCFLHDVVEDYPVRVSDIEALFGPVIAQAVDAISKVVEGVKKDPDAYREGLARNALASICKGIDRIHNQASMVGVFTRAKQMAYLEETDTLLLPMLKTARRTFPEQEAAYENIKFILMGQATLIRAFQSPDLATASIGA